jgi:hypothetical protein
MPLGTRFSTKSSGAVTKRSSKSKNQEGRVSAGVGRAATPSAPSFRKASLSEEGRPHHSAPREDAAHSSRESLPGGDRSVFSQQLAEVREGLSSLLGQQAFLDNQNPAMVHIRQRIKEQRDRVADLEAKIARPEVEPPIQREKREVEASRINCYSDVITKTLRRTRDPQERKEALQRMLINLRVIEHDHAVSREMSARLKGLIREQIWEVSAAHRELEAEGETPGRKRKTSPRAHDTDLETQMAGMSLRGGRRRRRASPDRASGRER